MLLRPPTPYLPAPNACSSECAVYSSVLVVVDVVELNVMFGCRHWFCCGCGRGGRYHGSGHSFASILFRCKEQ